MSQPEPRRRGGPAVRAEVVSAENVTPHMRRVVLSGPGGEPLPIEFSGLTDAYVKLVLPRPGSGVREPFDVDELKETLSAEQWPVLRTYTIRAWDAQTGRMTLDFVVHGDEGIAGPWSVAVEPGDQVQFRGPGGGYAPDPAADWHLLMGDESALPAIAAALEAMPTDAPVRAFIEVSDPAEEQPLLTAAQAQVRWIHRDTSPRPPGVELVEAVRELEFLPGRVQAFVHGDADVVREIRSHLRFEREIPTADLSISGYWRRGLDDEGWRAAKREWNAAVDAEETAHA
ncbi:siderophore-interacting protein [Occultella glacieicola]|uniref:Siderophore-interacting protein n=1 Tax=Occultella glacieicola TaxID=2518684 RepID=A0ABY2DXD8_9MICO|nr:siderophore-interacting protein [Occultella glacieicola]TDE88801.1 siderophore-interacting protein [Occultella glacieicola]